jgi:hypothetical protein
MIDLIVTSFLPIIDEKEVVHSCEIPRKSWELIIHGSITTVIFQVGMLALRQRFEPRWEDTTEMAICELLALYSHAREDGMPLEEPKLWDKARMYDVVVDESVSNKET